jgi:hypothetical protein
VILYGFELFPVALFSGFPRAVKRAGQLCALSAGQAWKLGGFAIDRCVIAVFAFFKNLKILS